MYDYSNNKWNNNWSYLCLKMKIKTKTIITIIIAIILMIISVIFWSNFVSAYDQQALFICGGDSQTKFLCPFADNQTILNNKIQGEAGITGGGVIEKNITEQIKVEEGKKVISYLFLFIISFIVMILIILCIIFWYKRRKKSLNTK